MGHAYFLCNQPAEVLACAACGTEHWQDSTPRNKAFANQLLGHGYKLNKDYPADIAVYREVVEIHRSISPESEDVSIALSDLAAAESLNEDNLAAERDFREALRIAKIVKHDEHAAVVTVNLAGLALDREQWAEAETLAREALPLAEKVGRQELIAYDCHCLAKALLKQNKNLEKAKTLAQRAVEINTRLRLPDDVRSAQEMLAEIEKAMQK